jgi:N-acetylglucosamine kinase-like BadF-type ATPase
MKYFLGVDGGQSGTTAVIGDEAGSVLGTGEAGPCNHAGAAEGRAKLERAVTASVAAACAAAKLDAETIRFEAACFGMSGGPDDKREILAGILRADRLIVTTDAEIALAGATESGRGIIVIAGTGSIAYGRNDEGRAARAGGWGYVFGDEGGAFDIVRQALRAALRMEEGWGPATSLRGALIEATGAADANGALHRLYTAEWPRSRAAALAPLVDQAADNGDSMALRIINDAAAQLATLAGSVRGQLWPRRAALDVAYIGGVFESLRLLERFRLLVELEEGVRCVAPLRGPAEGALRESLTPPAGPSLGLLS